MAQIPRFYNQAAVCLAGVQIKLLAEDDVAWLRYAAALPNCWRCGTREKARMSHAEYSNMIEGTLNKMLSGSWAICRSGKNPIEIKHGDIFRIEVDGKMRPTRMEFEGDRGYHSADGYQLRSGLRAALARH
jgi:hypothetical protein